MSTPSFTFGRSFGGTMSPFRGGTGSYGTDCAQAQMLRASTESTHGILSVSLDPVQGVCLLFGERGRTDRRRADTLGRRLGQSLRESLLAQSLRDRGDALVLGVEGLQVQVRSLGRRSVPGVHLGLADVADLV